MTTCTSESASEGDSLDVWLRTDGQRREGHAGFLQRHGEQKADSKEARGGQATLYVLDT
jgi:hypothetical protein